MGYNTAAIILNDGMDQLEKDPDAGKKIHRAMLSAHREPQTIALGNHCNPMMILPARHADEDQLILVGGNYIRPVARLMGMPHRVGPEQLELAVLEQLAKRLGYTLRKRK